MVHHEPTDETGDLRTERYSRQEVFPPIGPSGQRRLRDASVLLVGCGALGTHVAEHLARAGVGTMRLVDRDCVEWSNLHRQIGYTEDDARCRRAKAAALEKHLRAVNSEVRAVPHAVEFHFANARGLARGVDILLDGTDNLLTRFLINDVSYALGIPWIYAGAVGSEGHAQVFSGRRGPCLRCMLGELPPPGTLATCDTAGVLGPCVAAIAGWESALALRVLVEGAADAVTGRYIRLDPWSIEARISPVDPDPTCPVCVGARYDVLAGLGATQAVRLCGRRAVQVSPPPASVSRRTDLGSLARRLGALGPVEETAHFVRWRGDGFVATVFSDGRAVFDGLTDLERARSLYASLIGT